MLGSPASPEGSADQGPWPRWLLAGVVATGLGAHRHSPREETDWRSLSPECGQRAGGRRWHFAQSLVARSRAALVTGGTVPRARWRTVRTCRGSAAGPQRVISDCSRRAWPGGRQPADHRRLCSGLQTSLSHRRAHPGRGPTLAPPQAAGDTGWLGCLTASVRHHPSLCL